MRFPLLEICCSFCVWRTILRTASRSASSSSIRDTAFFTVKHQKWAVLLNVNLLCLVLRFLFFAGADGLSCFIQLHWVEALGLLPKPGILVQGSVQLGGIFLFLFFQPFQALLHGGDVFGKFIGGIFLGICQRRQKQIFLRTQFLQILCQCRNLSRQFPVPEHMDSR